MSVFVENTMIACGQTATALLQDEWANHFVAAITAGWARQCEQGVVPSPTETEPAHADVRGPKPTNMRKKLAKPAEWVIPPPDLNMPDK